MRIYPSQGYKKGNYELHVMNKGIALCWVRVHAGVQHEKADKLAKSVSLGDFPLDITLSKQLQKNTYKKPAKKLAYVLFCIFCGGNY